LATRIDSFSMTPIAITSSQARGIGPDTPHAQHGEMAQQLEVALFRTDTCGQWTALSDAWTHISGHAVGACLGVPARQFVHVADRLRYAALSQNLLQNPGQFFRQTLRICKAGGQSGWIEVYAAMQFDNQGTPLAGCGYLADVTPAAPQHLRRRAMRAVQDEHHGMLDRMTITGPLITAPAQTALNVLLIEDQPVTQKLLRLVLEKWGHHVHIAADGRTGLESYLQRTFDLVLMDLQLPAMDGLSVSMAIRTYESQGELTRTPIIALTAQTAPGDRETCFAAGMDHYLPKPVSARALQEMLQTCGCD
jgi:PAS domain S-box-containing protein